MTNFENFFTFAPDISSNTFAAKQDSDLTSFWVTTYLFSFILRETCVSTKVNCSYGVSKFKPSGQNFFTFRGKTITKHEQIWNLSSDWVWIWVRRNCTLLLRQSIPKLLFCRAASTYYLEQGIDIWINLVFQVTDMTSCKILEWIDYYLHISPCHVAKRRRPANFGSLGAAKY